jgi:hypothetical protein
MYWDNETNLSVRLKENIKDSTYQSKDGKVIWKSKDQKKECHLYELDGFEYGGFEIEVVLHEKPTSNVIEYTIETKELNFFYQPELTSEEVSAGIFRPANVVGSYAVYHKSKRDNGPHGEYRTGKAFHIYRPLATDSQVCQHIVILI